MWGVCQRRQVTCSCKCHVNLVNHRIDGDDEDDDDDNDDDGDDDDDAG